MTSQRCVCPGPQFPGTIPGKFTSDQLVHRQFVSHQLVIQNTRSRPPGSPAIVKSSPRKEDKAADGRGGEAKKKKAVSEDRLVLILLRSWALPLAGATDYLLLLASNAGRGVHEASDGRRL
jgi:hypothetical protein